MAKRKRVRPPRTARSRTAEPVTPRLSAFAIMPFRPVENVMFGRVIRPLCDELGFDVDRADTTLNQRAIMQDVIEGIQRSDLIIADLTGRNANVFYELGLAHALRKPVILLAQSTSDIPFDLGAYRAVIYDVDIGVADDGDLELSESASVELRTLLSAVRSGDVVFSSPFLDYGTPEAVVEETLEPGVIDQMAEFLTASPEYQEAMQQIGGITTEMGEETKGLTAEMQTANSADNPVQFALAMIGRAAALWTRYADRLEPVVNDRLLPVADRLERSGAAEARAAILSEDLARYERAVQQARELSATSLGAAESVRGFVEVIRSTSQWGTALRRPSERLATILERVVAHFERIAALPATIEALPGGERLA